MSRTRQRLLDRLPMSERTIEVAGIRTAVLEGGSGTPLVLLHGQGEFAATWMGVIPQLVRTHRVIVPDLPGHGASGVPDRQLDRETAIDWLAQLIAATCDRSPVVAGHLLGGALAARTVAARPGLVRRLVLVDTLGLRWYRPSLGFGVAMAAFAARPTERSRERLFQRCFVDLDAMRERMDGDMELLESYALECAEGPTLTPALRALVPAVGLTPIADDELASIDVPVTLVWGREDLQTPLRTAEAASQRFGWPLHVVDGAADDPAVERPDAFLAALEDELATTTPGTTDRSAR